MHTYNQHPPGAHKKEGNQQLFIKKFFFEREREVKKVFRLGRVESRRRKPNRQQIAVLDGNPSLSSLVN